VTFTRENGKIFYFQPGHEEYPIYRMPLIQQIIINAVRWAAPVNRLTAPPDNVEAVRK
jgi:trehalose utilization protein